jgi:hypothetical protein
VHICRRRRKEDLREVPRKGTHTARDDDLHVVVVPMQADGTVRVIESDNDGSHARAVLVALVNKILVPLRAHMRAVGSARSGREGGRVTGAKKRAEER